MERADLCAVHYWSKLMKDRCYHEANRSKRNKAVRDRHKLYAEQGKCRDCGVDLIEGEGTRCTNCQDNHNIHTYTKGGGL